MKQIPLSKDRYALVDDDDFIWLSQWKWRARTYPYTHIVYAIRVERIGKKRRVISMHRQILDPDINRVVDHINGDGLDNRRCNLRVCSHTDNMRNRRLGKNNTSGYKGVTWRKSRNKWTATIYLDGKAQHLGYFSDSHDAAMAYDRRAKELFGDFAKLNIDSHNRD